MKPYVPADVSMPEFTIKALIIGLVMSVVLGAANAYLGLKAGMTIAATYPAAVIGMAVLRIFKGNILEENFARTVGSIGESVAAGAIFTIPAFLSLTSTAERHIIYLKHRANRGIKRLVDTLFTGGSYRWILIDHIPQRTHGFISGY